VSARDEPRTRDDARFQCANGIAAINAGIAAGQTRELAPEQGEIGRQVVVTPPPDFVYERRIDTDWWGEAESIRAQLPALVAALAGVDSIPTSEQLRAMTAAR